MNMMTTTQKIRSAASYALSLMDSGWSTKESIEAAMRLQKWTSKRRRSLIEIHMGL